MSLTLFTGSMFGGKTSALLAELRRFQLADQACLLLKHSSDARFDAQNVTTHDGVAVRAVCSDTLGAQLPAMLRCSHVFIDEIQFFPDLACLEQLVTAGVTVFAAGLLTQFNGTPFPCMQQHISLWTDIRFFHGVCVTCKSVRACRTMRLTPVTQHTNMVGGSESYAPVCHACHLHWLNDLPSATSTAPETRAATP